MILRKRTLTKSSHTKEITVHDPDRINPFYCVITMTEIPDNCSVWGYRKSHTKSEFKTLEDAFKSFERRLKVSVTRGWKPIN